MGHMDITETMRLNRSNLKRLTKKELDHLQDSKHISAKFKLTLLLFRSRKIKVR